MARRADLPRNPAPRYRPLPQPNECAATARQCCCRRLGPWLRAARWGRVGRPVRAGARAFAAAVQRRLGPGPEPGAKPPDHRFVPLQWQSRCAGRPAAPAFHHPVLAALPRNSGHRRPNRGNIPKWPSSFQMSRRSLPRCRKRFRKKQLKFYSYQPSRIAFCCLQLPLYHQPDAET